MLWWDEELIELLVKNNIITNAGARYMDDIRIWLWSIMMEWRWTGKEMEYCAEWREEDRRKGITPLRKTTEILAGMMNLTMETGDDFQDGRLPTLDLNIWIGQNNKVLYIFFEKPMASKQTIQERSAMP